MPSTERKIQKRQNLSNDQKMMQKITRSLPETYLQACQKASVSSSESYSCQFKNCSKDQTKNHVPSTDKSNCVLEEWRQGQLMKHDIQGASFQFEKRDGTRSHNCISNSVNARSELSYLKRDIHVLEILLISMNIFTEKHQIHDGIYTFDTLTEKSGYIRHQEKQLKSVSQQLLILGHQMLLLTTDLSKQTCPPF